MAENDNISSLPQTATPTQREDCNNNNWSRTQISSSQDNKTAITLAGNKTLNPATNLATLLPTGTVLVFEALLPSFSKNGDCELANKYLTLTLIVVCSVLCFLSSFTDSFTFDGKLYYGIATFKGLYVFNDDQNNDREKDFTLDLSKYKLAWVDFVHAFATLFVFLAFAISSSNVQNCFSKVQKNDQLVINLPLGVGIFAGLLFSIFPTKRRAIGSSDSATTRSNNKDTATATLSEIRTQ